MIEAADAMLKTAKRHAGQLAEGRCRSGDGADSRRRRVRSRRPPTPALPPARRVGELVGVHVIPRPADGLEKVFPIK
jgi:hypothetical protein